MPKKRPGNQHNNRHENGVVAPGRRITKQRSSPQINGSAANGNETAIPPSPSSSGPDPAALVPEMHMNGLPAKPMPENDEIQAKLAVEAMDPSTEPPIQANGAPHCPITKPELASPTCGARRKDTNLNLALTIIRSCPLGDTLTILIILLSLPSTLLTLINTLFATLTFMPPAGSFFSLPNTLNDIFQGAGGTPSVATIIITDILGLLIWLVAWTPVQSLAIEYAQAVVAATLGGSNSNKKTGYDSTFLCVMIVTTRYFSSRGWIPARLLLFDWRAVLSRIPFVSFHASTFTSESTNDPFMIESKGGWDWFRILIALHILIQGLVHVARRWYQKREYFHSTPVGKRHDPEAGGQKNARPSLNPSDTSHSGNNVPSPSPTTKIVASTAKDYRERAPSGKKRRKQAAMIRSQQPLWAAFAATKVTIMREYDQKNSMADFDDANARDVSDLGNATFSSTDNQTWIIELNPDNFLFRTTCSSTSTDSSQGSESQKLANTNRVGPFYVRVNDTDWTSTKISRYEPDSDEFGGWSCLVFGLAPSSSYKCTIISDEGDVELASITVTTLPSPLEDAEPKSASTEVSEQSARPYRPTSPTTTLKKSIAAFESGLSECVARQKRNKKENKSVSASTKKEIDMLNTKIAKLSIEDRSHTNRHMQWNQHIKQADEAVTAIDDELAALDKIPDDESQAHKERKTRWQNAKQEEATAMEELARGKENAQREKAVIQNEANAARQKKERLQARKSKLSDQLEKLESEEANDALGKGLRHSPKATEGIERLQIEQELHNQIKGLTQEFYESRHSVEQLLSQLQQLENAYQERIMLSKPSTAQGERPLTPEGDLPGENPLNAPAAAPQIPAFGTPESGGIRSHSGSLRQADRLRSSSLQSGNSNYVDFDDQDPAPVPQMPLRAVEAIREARKRSGGSLGGSSGSNSQRDPASPVGGNRVQDSPLGKKPPIWN